MFCAEEFQTNEIDIYLDQVFRNVAEEYQKKHRYFEAVKLLIAGAAMCHSGQSQYALGSFYYFTSKDVDKDLYALYWFDQAADNDINQAEEYRYKILTDYKKSLSSEDFNMNMLLISYWCLMEDENLRNENIPRTPSKDYDYWIHLLSNITKSTRNLGDDYYFEYSETSNSMGGYHPVGIRLKNKKK